MENIFSTDLTRRDFTKQMSAAALLAGIPAFSGGCTSSPAKDIAAKILIIGGGAAGIIGALQVAGIDRVYALLFKAAA